LIIYHAFCRSMSIRLVAGMLLLLVLRPAVAGQQTILMVGDSISAAYGMSLEQGWVALMAGQIAQSHPQYSLVNASISGETSSGALYRLPKLLTEHQPAVVIFELGGNDGLRGYPLKTLRSNLTAMAQLSLDAGARVIITTMAIPPNYGGRYTRGFTESFALVADDTDSILAPFLLQDVANHPELMQADGIHPTVEAQSILVDNFLPTLMEVLQ
jgi:acyl-CoA thioesterase-1